MNPVWFAGVDGGQSSTVAVVGNETGAVAGRGTAGPADEIGQGADSTRLRDALDSALTAARAAASMPFDATFAAIVAGVSGYEGRVYGAPPALPGRHVSLVHDAPIAHAGALAGEDGVTAIAGTGSVVYSTAGIARTRGGWGYAFGDEGSAFWIARETLAQLMREADERPSEAANLAEGDARSACAFFGVPSLRALTRAFYSGEIQRQRIAAFAPLALRTAEGPSIAARGARRLATLVAAAVRDGAPARVALVGGMFGNDGFREQVKSAIVERVPDADVRSPSFEPAVGALLLAYRNAGRAFHGDRGARR